MRKSLLCGLFVTLVCSVGFGQINQPGGGGGSGTVSANNGSAGAVANYAAAGGSTTVGPDAALIDNGTQWLSTEVFRGPAGTSASNTYGDTAGTEGMNFTAVAGAGGVTFAASSTGEFGIANVGTGFFLPLGNGIGWTTGTLSAGLGTNITTNTSGLVEFNSTTSSNEAALTRSANPCRVTADITLPVNTATTVCTWTLPAVAKAWAWQCQIPWIISAGTGTNTLAIVANPSQTPTAATNGSAEIKTTNANAATEATTVISASGGTTILTSGTITPAATVFMSSTSGTLLASATAGTFAIQMTAAGTTATAAAKAGATCILY